MAKCSGRKNVSGDEIQDEVEINITSEKGGGQVFGSAKHFHSMIILQKA